jgi:indole-3-glycerol phosphate synthase
MGFLEKMIAATEAAIAQPEYLTAIPPIRRLPVPSLRAAVLTAGPGGALVAEFKRRSPGAAAPDLHPPSVASQPEFGGAPTDVAALAARTSLPILFKDFVVDPIQVEAAARAGASAVLLIARLEVEGRLRCSLRSLAQAAHGYGLEVLLEWHGRAELRQTEDVPADVYGVNVRDLDSLKMQPEVAEATIRAAAPFRPLLGLSGVEGPVEARRFWDAGVDGILVGTALARAAEPGPFLSGLRRPVAEERA